MRRLRPILLPVFVLLLWSSACAADHTLTQISAFDALLNGVYDGATTLGELKRYGDFGLGTFNALDGEMVVLDGRVYQITSSGKVQMPPDNQCTPFAAVTHFQADEQHAVSPGDTFQTLTAALDKLLPTPNLFYAIRIGGVFQTVKTRSVPSQTPPYPPLVTVVATQPVFRLTNVRGTLVGLRCPPYVKGINVPGYHLHFLTADHTAGGHVLDFTVQSGNVQIERIANFRMLLPGDDAFYHVDLSQDNEAETTKVEK